MPAKFKRGTPCLYVVGHPLAAPRTRGFSARTWRRRRRLARIHFILFFAGGLFAGLRAAGLAASGSRR